MKKKFSLWLVAMVFGVLFLSACSAVAGAAQGVVDLPDTLEANITALVLVGVSWLFVQVVTLLPFLAFLNDFKVPLAMGIATQLIGLIEGAVPDAYGAVAILAIQLILAVVALFLTAEKLKARGVKGFK
jgi:hypothetical protein